MEFKLRVVDLEARKIIYYSDECCLVNAIDLYESDKTKYRLELWTGLKDKNGEKIWQGDIIQQGKDVSVVKYDPPEFIAMAEISEDHCCNLLIGECEVIGNIYENPELLKQ